MTVLHKSCQMEVKAADDIGTGQFEAYVSVFDNRDASGDVVRKGAFADTLADWADRGKRIPVVFSHQSDNLTAYLGHVLEAKETDRGLWVKGQLKLTRPNAQQVYEMMLDGEIDQFSFAYSVKDGSQAYAESIGNYFELRKLDLYEVGPTLVGMNSETELLAVKAAHALAEAKAGRVLSAKNETALRNAYDAIGQVLSALETEAPKAQVIRPANTEEPRRANAEELRVDLHETAKYELDLELSV